MYLTDDPAWYYGSLPPIPERSQKKLFLSDKYAIDGETATETITIGTMKQREGFIDSLAQVTCFDGQEDLHLKFKQWLKESKQ